jgi:fatty acid desaturase
MSAPPKVLPLGSRDALDVETLLLLAFQWIVFVGNFAFYFTDPFPLWVHMAITLVPIHVAFTIWHEAAHGNVSRTRLVNNAVGVLGMFPYMTPYFLQRYVHLDHHKYLNQPVKDPNQIYADGPLWQLPLRYVRTIGYARQMIRDDPRNAGMRLSDNIGLALLAGVWLLALVTGHFVDLLLVWFVPLVIAKLVMDWYVNYLPHVGLPPHRYLGTRVVDVRWLTPLVLNHNYHAIHHLWPGIPWHRYPATYRAKHDYLVDHDVPIEHRVFGGRTHPRPETPPGGPARRAPGHPPRAGRA